MEQRFEDVAEKPPDMKSAIVTSVVAHVVLLLVLTVRAFLFPSEPLQIESAIRVDIVGLPEKSAKLPPPIEEPKPDAQAAPPPPTTKDLPPVVKEVPQEAKPVVLKPTKPDPKQQKKNQDAALKRLEAMARLDRQARTEAINKALSDARTNAPAAVRGNQISKGSSLSGLTRLDHDKYLGEVESRFKSHWRPPKFLANAKLHVRVVVFIDATGVITRRTITQSSGNSVFDESAIAAIEASVPLPPPPDSLQGILANQGVELDLEPGAFR